VVRPKKHLGQHFLKDTQIAARIAQQIQPQGKYSKVLEIGAGTGVLTNELLENTEIELYALDIDDESIAYLIKHFPSLDGRIIQGDFLEIPWHTFFDENTHFGVIGNFPYNISSQIFFKVLEYKEQIPEVVGMLQKEVAQRLASPPGSRAYGILSVLLQAFYDIEYCFEVPPHVFLPPPKVDSAVIRLVRNEVKELECDEILFKKVVKIAFNQRRKMLRNALKPILPPEFNTNIQMLDRRAETLSVADFVFLTQEIEKLI
jgi:16S rRNA (adenine1518-N6/adenine1519-N6)-dimethyltransferase